MHELHDISDLDPDGLPSKKRLAKVTIVALTIAAVLLTLVVLPAEYGIDPTGLGQKMGLTALNTPPAGPATPEPPATLTTATPNASPANLTSGALRESRQAYRSDSMTLTLAPHQGAEIKAIMQAGGHFVFDWQAAGGVVYFDMHGNPPNADENTFTSFQIAESASNARGSFTAPFLGNHGWYWENRGDESVTIQLKTSGFYEALYMP